MILSLEVLDPGTGGGAESCVSQLVHKDVRDGGVKMPSKSL